jgi:Flp pilus assembly protein TadD
MIDAAVFPGDPDALYVHGLLHLRAGNHARAIDSLDAALLLRPGHSGTRRNLIRALLATGQSQAVLLHADIALQSEPDIAELHYVRGTALNALGCPAEAAATLLRAVALDPQHAASWLNLGNACADLDDLDAAEQYCRTAIALDPMLVEGHASLGYLLTAKGDLAGGIAACETAIRLHPRFVQAHWNLATTALLAGDLPRGFQEYEWRKRHDRFRRDFINLPGPVWDGSDPAGRTILVKCEQGFGDTIQFSRYLPLIAAQGGHPILACEPPMVPLFADVPGVTAVPKPDPLPPYDAWIDQMSLPRVFGTTIDSIPTPGCYLRADPVRHSAWRTRLPEDQTTGRRTTGSQTIGGQTTGRRAAGPRTIGSQCIGSQTTGRRTIGLAWAGNNLHSNDRRRSMPPALLAPILVLPDVNCISLQYGETLDGLCDLTPMLTDFAETAALIARLDLVITVDTAVAHLAGALGVPTWIMLPHAPDWRWLLGRDDSPWYASVRLFRQATPGDWGGVVARVVAALSDGRARDG